MAKSKTPAAAKTAAAAKTDTPVAAAPVTPPAAPATPEIKVSLAKMRGPRGVAETAKIKLISASNPKREGSKAHAVFSCYKDGMTVGQFCDAVDATENKGAATPNLVYDAGHGFISIEGYDPGEIVQPKPKAPPKEPKAPKAKKEAAAPVVAAQVAAKKKQVAEVEQQAKEEVMD